MKTAYDLLMNSQEDTMVLSDNDNMCVIDPVSRTITVPQSIVVGGVQSDKNAERIKFQCPKIVGDNLLFDSLILNKSPQIGKKLGTGRL